MTMETAVGRVVSAVVGMTVAQLLGHMRRVDACSESFEWVESLAPLAPAAEAWATCQRGDWMLWLCRAARVDTKLRALVGCDLGRKALPWWEKHHPEDKTVAASVAAVEAWALGTGTAEDMRAAVRAARGSRRKALAAWRADAYAYAYADAYAYAYADAYADADAYAYAYAYAYADAYAYAYAGRECADVVRQRITWQVVEAALLAQVSQ